MSEIGIEYLLPKLKPDLRDAYLLESAAYRNLNQPREADALLAQLSSIPLCQSAFDEWQPNVDYRSYFNYLQAAVRARWTPPQGLYAPAVPIFKVHRSGQISELRLNNGIGNAAADAAALQAVKDSVPFRQPPAGAPPDFDMYVVLDNLVKAPAQQAVAPPNAVPAGAGEFNWGGTINQSVNQGFSLMNRLRVH